MWELKFEEIVRERKTCGKAVNQGATDEDIEKFIKSATDELCVTLPHEYVMVLKKVNGIEFNGFILYGIDEALLSNTPQQRINGFLESNKIWYENPWQKEYIFFGESNISWYVYKISSKKYYELDNPSGRIMEEYCGFYSMLEQMLSDALL